jgi:hypothetical protein
MVGQRAQGTRLGPLRFRPDREAAVSTTAIALVAENTVLLAGIAAGWHLLRQGGGLQVKTPPVPKRQAQDKADAAGQAPDKPLRSAS